MNARDSLLKMLIPFYSRLEDKLYGGFYGRVDSNLNIYKRASRSMIQTARMLWFFATVSKRLDQPDLFEKADCAYAFLTEHGRDTAHGGLYWATSYSGLDIEDETKNALCQATGILAYVAYGKGRALDFARDLFDLLESRFFEGCGYAESFNEDYTAKLTKNHFMATLLHIIESYTVLLQTTGDQKVRKALIRNLEILETSFYSPSTASLMEMHDQSGACITTQTLYGHEMECVHLVGKACEVLGLPRPAYLDELLASALEAGFQDGWLAYSERKKEAVHWVQAHAVVAILYSYRKTNDPRFLDKANAIIDYIESHIVMHVPGGEWFYDDTKLSKDVVSVWKGPYNNTSMYLEMMEE